MNPTAGPPETLPASLGTAAPSLRPHLHAIVTAASTLFLIFAGGLVKSHEVGLSVPDWPTTYGENMFTYPPSRWVGGVFYEHGHRLLGALVGLLTLVLALQFSLSVAWKSRVRRWVRVVVAALLGATLLRQHGERLFTSLVTLAAILVVFELGLRGPPERRRWIRRLGLLALIAVSVQGLLGGLTVHYLLPMPISVAHACLAQAFLCLMIGLAVFTSHGWIAAEPQLAGAAKSGMAPEARLWRLWALATGAVYLQLLLGAVMRHLEAGLAIPDFPLAFGRLLPPLDSTEVFVHFAHRLGALLVSVLLLVAAVSTLRHRGAGASLRGLAALVVAGLCVQLTLGAYTIWTQRQPLLTSLHVVTGAALLGLCFLLGLRCYQKLAPGSGRA